jgi:hypothetical protein
MEIKYARDRGWIKDESENLVVQKVQTDNQDNASLTGPLKSKSLVPDVHHKSGWNLEFAKVIQCTNCTALIDANLLRDVEENVPQPGYIGKKYLQARVILIGQNPGTPKSLVMEDRPYTAALRTLSGSFHCRDR